MNPQLLELMRNHILCLASDGGRRGIGLNAFHVGLKIAGYDITDAKLQPQLDYLEGKKFLDRASGEVSAGLSRYSLTAAGREYLEANGLL